MTKQLKYLILLISLSLVSILGLQAYFLYTDFQAKKVDFKNDLNTMLEVTTKEMNKLRNKKINALHRRDMLDTSYVKLEFNLDLPEGPEMKVINAETGDNELTLSIKKDTLPENARTKEYLLDLFFKPAHDDDEGNMLWAISFSLSGRLSAYQDTLGVDIDLFETKLAERMGERSITPDYQMVFVQKDSSFSFEDEAILMSDRFRLNHHGTDQEVIVYFEESFFNVLQRSYLLLVASLGVLIVIALSFIMLMKTINKQRKLSKLKDDFIDNVTHELLTPIATMKIALETLQKPEALAQPEKVDKYVTVSVQELDRISGIVHNVLQTSLHEQNEVRLSFEEVRLNDVINELITYHTNKSDKAIQFIFEPKGIVTMNTDKQHITNVLHNLIDNALKYNTKEMSVVNIDLEQNSSEISITISDNGLGINSDHTDKIFDKFHRAINKGAENVSGLGVGLYYVRNVLNRLNGSIDLLNTSSKGSTFKVSLKTKTI